MLTGGCFCGAVRYAAEGEPFERALCHCLICRRASGAPALAWFSVPLSGFRYTAGEPVRFASSTEADREFCGRCGAHLSFRRHDYPDRLDLTTASLDDPEAAPPSEHIWTSRRLSWMTGLDALPEHRSDDWHDRAD